MENKEVSKKEPQSVEKTSEPTTDVVFIPDVDICETEEEVKLVADMPGVEQSSTNVTVENNVLTIEGNALCDVPEGYQLVGQEYGVGKFRRDFTLSDQIDTDGIKARVRHGLLELTLPKREEVKTRKIEISA